MTRRTIRQIALSELKPYGNNPRKHSSSQIEAMAKSIEEFGFTVPVLVTDKNELIAGHGRVEAATSLGLEKVPGITLTGLTKKQVKAYRVLDNKLSDMSRWDNQLLADELISNDFDWSQFGFTDAELLAAHLDTNDHEETDSGVNTGSPTNLVSLSLAMDAHERDVVFAAIKAAKRHYDLADNVSALIRICKEFNDGIQAD